VINLKNRKEYFKNAHQALLGDLPFSKLNQSYSVAILLYMKNMSMDDMGI
jgi:hypothetical protein